MNIIITGGSRGIGAEAVRVFAGQGHRVRFLYEKNHGAAQAVAAQTGAEAVCCDVADKEAVWAALHDFPADVLINNAGIAHYGLISQIGKEHWDRMFAVNVHGMYHCIDAVLSHMLQNSGLSLGSSCILSKSFILQSVLS